MPRKDWDKDLARKMYDDGATDREISESVDVTVSTISRWRKANSLPPRGLPRTHMDSEKARQLYDRGYPDADIAEELGVSASSVRNWRRDNDLPLNRKWDQKKALLLYNEGYGDEEIAREVDADPKKIWAWRESQGLPSVAPAASQAGDEEDEEPEENTLGSQLVDVPLDVDLPKNSETPNPELEDDDYDEADDEEEEDLYASPSRRTKRPTVLEAALEVFWSQGYMIGELAMDLEIDPALVASWVERTHPEEMDRQDFDTAEAMELLQAGRQDRDIATEMDVPARAVTAWRRRHDYVAQAPVAFDEEKAEELFRRGMYDRDIARELGGDVTKADVQAWRARNNLSLYMDKGRQDLRSRNDRSVGRRTPGANRAGYEERSYPNNRSAGRSNQRYQNNFSSGYSGNSYPRENTSYQRDSYSQDNGQRRPQRPTDRRQTDSYGAYESAPRRPRRSWDTEEARRLWEDGLSDSDIARQVGTSVGAIRAWRQQNNLRSPR